MYHGYLGDPALNDGRFLPGGWFRTGDLGVLDEAGLLHLTGRVSEIINRGGERIDPSQVEAVLLAHPDIVLAGVYTVPHAVLGEDHRAAVVLRTGATTWLRSIRRWMLGRLPSSKVPRVITILDALPLTGSGKVARAKLAAAVEAVAAAGSEADGALPR